jgi:murein DD-endopeptidase MepM/ murein hydrolase activator NlpD
MRQRIIGFLLFVCLILLFLCSVRQLYYLDKAFFFCPIEYKQDTIIIRHDSYGSGDFLAERNGARKHNGIDLQADIGTPVYAVRGAKVREARFHKGLGNYVELFHPGGYVSIYAHLSKIEVKENQLVRQGQKIGEVGRTGNAGYRGIIPHLHFELRYNDTPVDPMKFLE